MGLSGFKRQTFVAERNLPHNPSPTCNFCQNFLPRIGRSVQCSVTVRVGSLGLKMSRPEPIGDGVKVRHHGMLCGKSSFCWPLSASVARRRAASLSFAERRGPIYIRLIAPAMRSPSQGVNYLTRGDVSRHEKTLLLTKITR